MYYTIINKQIIPCTKNDFNSDDLSELYLRTIRGKIYSLSKEPMPLMSDGDNFILLSNNVKLKIKDLIVIDKSEMSNLLNTGVDLSYNKSVDNRIEKLYNSAIENKMIFTEKVLFACMNSKDLVNTNKELHTKKMKLLRDINKYISNRKEITIELANSLMEFYNLSIIDILK